MLDGYKISAKKYRGVMSHDTEEWYKIWRKTDLRFVKLQEEFGKFLPEHSKASQKISKKVVKINGFL